MSRRCRPNNRRTTLRGRSWHAREPNQAALTRSVELPRCTQYGLHGTSIKTSEHKSVSVCLTVEYVPNIHGALVNHTACTLLAVRRLADRRRGNKRARAGGDLHFLVLFFWVIDANLWRDDRTMQRWTNLQTGCTSLEVFSTYQSIYCSTLNLQ